jgi:hypothetical protein
VYLFVAIGAIFHLYVSGGCHNIQTAILDLCLALIGFNSEGSLGTGATRDRGFYGLIRRTGTNVSQWDSNIIRSLHRRSNHSATRATILLFRVKCSIRICSSLRRFYFFKWSDLIRFRIKVRFRVRFKNRVSFGVRVRFAY